MKSLIALASTLAIAAAGTGQLPKVVHQVRIAQLQILKQMQTKNWGTAIKSYPSENCRGASGVFRLSFRRN